MLTLFPARGREEVPFSGWSKAKREFDEPLSIVEWSHDSAALSPEKQADGLFQAITSLERHPLHSRYLSEIAKMRSAAAQIAAEWRDSGYLFGELGNLTKGLVQAAWATTAEVPPIAIGRTPAFKLEKS